MKKKKQSAGAALFTALVIGFIAIIIISGYFLFLREPSQMEAAYNAAKQEAYDKHFQLAFDRSEKKNHVANYAVINIENVRELSRLEVLKVSDTQFVIERPEDNDQKITSWLEVKGIGVFTVDLAMSQFIADSERGYVVARVPWPELTECKVEGTGKQLWKNDWRNDSVGDGVRLSQKQLGEGQKLLENSMKSNQRFYSAAEESAKWMIRLLVQRWNPQIPDLEVEVEFVDELY